jgi:hypothetical protein
MTISVRWRQAEELCETCCAIVGRSAQAVIDDDVGMRIEEPVPASTRSANG